MTQLLLVVAVALTVGAIVFGITVLVTGDEDGLRPVEPDGRSLPLPGRRPLAESDVAQLRFDTALRGYRMAQVDAALRRTAYDIGYKDELVRVLQAEVDALREGRFPDAEVLRRAREAALAPVEAEAGPAVAVPAAEEPASQEPASQETASQETAGEETAGEETAGEETAGEETAGEETAGQETAGQEIASQETASQRTANQGTATGGEAEDGRTGDEPTGTGGGSAGGAGGTTVSSSR